MENNYSPLALELNNVIEQQNASVFSLFSSLGRRAYFPKGIVAQGAEASEKANVFNATVGIATKSGHPLGLNSVLKQFNGIEAKDLIPYAPGCGRPDLRRKWKESLLEKNPSLKRKNISLPATTGGVTHAINVLADLFIDPNDIIITPDKFWENYNLLFGVMHRATLAAFPMFNASGGFNVNGLADMIAKHKSTGKLVIILNFPNNPTGYSPTTAEVKAITALLGKTAADGCRIISISDDSYFGLFYEKDVHPESLFAELAGLHDNILACKVDGATKELYVWGFRTGFLTFSANAKEPEKLYAAMEKKVTGVIRATVSTCPLPSQTVVLNAMNSPAFAGECAANRALLRARAMKVKEVLASGVGAKYWDPYPFNSGYFMCVKLKKLNAEDFRRHLLEKHGVGVIADGERDVRIAFSSVEEENIKKLFLLMEQAAEEMS